MSERGFSLAESLVALAILGLLAVSLVPAFLTQVDANARSELRGASIAAAQQVLEELRLADPASLPDEGRTVHRVVVGPREFDVRVRYCSRTTFCDRASRHLLLEIFHEGRQTYDVETVYTQFR